MDEQGLFKQVRFTVSQKREIGEWLHDLSQRDNQSPAIILKSLALEKILKDKRMNGPQKRQAVYDKIFTRRFPAVSRFLTGARKRLDRLKVPEGVKIIPESLIETVRLRMEIRFSGRAGLKGQLAAIKNFTQSQEYISLCDYLERGTDGKNS